MNAHEQAYAHAKGKIEEMLSASPYPREMLGAVVWSNGDVTVCGRSTLTTSNDDGVPVKVFVGESKRVLWHQGAS